MKKNQELQIKSNFRLKKADVRDDGIQEAQMKCGSENGKWNQKSRKLHELRSKEGL